MRSTIVLSLPLFFIQAGMAFAQGSTPERFKGTAISGHPFPIPSCPPDQQAVIVPILPDSASIPSSASKATVFTRTTGEQVTIHLQTRLQGGLWQELRGAELSYDAECHP